MPQSLVRIPRVSRVRGFLETTRLLNNAAEVLLDHATTLGGTFYYYFGGVKRVLVVSDPLLLRHVLKDNAGNYLKSEIQVERIGEFAGEGLVTSHGEEWRQKRRLMQRAFRPDKLFRPWFMTWKRPWTRSWASSKERREAGRSTLALKSPE